MNNQFNFKSSLASFLREFIGIKQALGINVSHMVATLRDIDNFYVKNKIEESSVTREIFTTWRKTRINDCKCTIYDKISIWCQLTKFISSHGVVCFIPRMPPPPKIDFSPYIYTKEQLALIMQKSQELRMFSKNMDCTIFAMPALVRLLRSTGLRIHEALSIRNEDVHIEEGYILISKTKNGSERIVPLCESMKIVLRQYIFYRNRIPVCDIAEPTSFLFVKANGAPCRTISVYNWFKKILKECGIPHIGNRKGPRLHDLRHGMATDVLVQMAHNGIDLYAAMPILSACLGHKSLAATEHYVRLTTEMYPELLMDTSRINSFIYPTHMEGRIYEE